MYCSLGRRRVEPRVLEPQDRVVVYFNFERSLGLRRIIGRGEAAALFYH